jgi:hypothetical protein
MPAKSFHISLEDSMSSTSRVIRIIQHFTGCSGPEASRAALAICRDPEALELLLSAAGKCTIATAGVGYGGLVMASGFSPVSLPMIGVGAGIAAASGVAAKRFCTQMIEHGAPFVPSEIKDILR